MKKIAILLPVYNGAPYLERCVESVLRQTHGEFELWIGDDGSRDGSRAFVQNLRDARIHVSTSERAGLFPNLNSLLRKSEAPYVRVLCQDDVLEPHCLAEELAFFERNPEVMMTFTKGTVIDEKGQEVSRGAFHDLPEIMPPLLTLQHLYYHGCFPGNLSTVAMRRAALIPLGGFDERYRVAADYEMWFRLARHAPVGVLHQHLVRIRKHSRQLSMARPSGLRFIVENRRIRQQILPLLPEHAQTGARRFERSRHDVLDFHYTIRCLAAGRWLTAFKAIGEIGPARWLQAAGWWLWTMNNRRFRPQAEWILPGQPSWSSDEQSLRRKTG